MGLPPSKGNKHRSEKWCLTSESAVYSVDSPENHTADSLLNPAASFSLSSSSLRWEGLDFRAEAREAQLISDKLQLQPLNLNKE
ncbi:hypothetical protein L3Q82_018373 [Scortum barcoo]|uniref:Uncharacterized protein n=1 Tax=Scortum barcoo TaxID=214431 RepID=A0ACB8VJV4_9TELE|nr:hypothetical protein L3Q82_018373 [Scortum barcoo]